jgi:hypothetical protein
VSTWPVLLFPRLSELFIFCKVTFVPGILITNYEIKSLRCMSLQSISPRNRWLTLISWWSAWRRSWLQLIIRQQTHHGGLCFNSAFGD